MKVAQAKKTQAPRSPGRGRTHDQSIAAAASLPSSQYMPDDRRDVTADNRIMGSESRDERASAVESSDDCLLDYSWDSYQKIRKAFRGGLKWVLNGGDIYPINHKDGFEQSRAATGETVYTFKGKVFVSDCDDGARVLHQLFIILATSLARRLGSEFSFGDPDVKNFILSNLRDDFSFNGDYHYPKLCKTTSARELEGNVSAPPLEARPPSETLASSSNDQNAPEGPGKGRDKADAMSLRELKKAPNVRELEGSVTSPPPEARRPSSALARSSNDQIALEETGKGTEQADAMSLREPKMTPSSRELKGSVKSLPPEARRQSNPLARRSNDQITLEESSKGKEKADDMSLGEPKMTPSAREREGTLLLPPEARRPSNAPARSSNDQIAPEEPGKGTEKADAMSLREPKKAPSQASQHHYRSESEDSLSENCKKSAKASCLGSTTKLPSLQPPLADRSWQNLTPVAQNEQQTALSAQKSASVAKKRLSFGDIDSPPSSAESRDPKRPRRELSPCSEQRQASVPSRGCPGRRELPASARSTESLLLGSGSLRVSELPRPSIKECPNQHHLRTDSDNEFPLPDDPDDGFAAPDDMDSDGGVDATESSKADAASTDESDQPSTQVQQQDGSALHSSLRASRQNSPSSSASTSGLSLDIDQSEPMFESSPLPSRKTRSGSTKSDSRVDTQSRPRADTHCRANTTVNQGTDDVSLKELRNEILPRFCERFDVSCGPFPKETKYGLLTPTGCVLLVAKLAKSGFVQEDTKWMIEGRRIRVSSYSCNANAPFGLNCRQNKHDGTLYLAHDDLSILLMAQETLSVVYNHAARTGEAFSFSRMTSTQRNEIWDAIRRKYSGNMEHLWTLLAGKEVNGKIVEPTRLAKAIEDASAEIAASVGSETTDEVEMPSYTHLLECLGPADVFASDTEDGCGGGSYGVVTMKPFDNSKIRKKYPGMVIDGDEAFLWDEAIDDAADLKVIGYKDTLPARPLPMGAGRLKTESKVVCRAAQAFNISNEDSTFPGYLMGNLILPPKGIKDAESVGACAQTFTCVYGQPDAIEVAYGDPDIRDGTLDPATASRFFIKQGDMFRVPPGNTYRLENHSKEAEAYLTWTIIRPSDA